MNTDEGEVLPIGQDYSNVGNRDSHRPVRNRTDSILMSWEQFFVQFQKHVSKPATAELLACVEKIDINKLSSFAKEHCFDKEFTLDQCCKVVLRHIEELSDILHIELLEKELHESAHQQLMEMTVVICLFGRFNSGKSTMINSILGNEILPTSMSAQTTTPIKVVHKEDAHKGACRLEEGSCSECPVLIEESWREEEPDNALETNKPIYGAHKIKESLEKFDAKVKRNEHYRGKPDLLIKAHIPPFSGSSIRQRVYLVDTQGFGAASTQHREGLATRFLKLSSAYVYCVKYGETDDLKNQDDYKAIALKDRSVFTSGRFRVAITHFDEHHRKKRRRPLPVETQKQHIVDGINAAVGINFSKDNIICVSGQMALCARLLLSTPNQYVTDEAEDYLRYCSDPHYNGPMGQGFRIDERNTPAIADCLESNSGILDLEKCLNEMVKSSNDIWLQAIYGDCSRFIEGARNSMMDKLVAMQKDGEDKDKVYQEKLGFQQCFSKQLDELGKILQLSRKESDAYGHLEDAFDAEVEDLRREASSMIATFKRECEAKVQRSKYYPRDLQNDARAFLTKAHERLIQNHLLKHIYAVLPLLGETVGRKRQGLANTAQRYANVTVTNKAIAWPPGLTTTTGLHIVEEQPNLSEIIKRIRLIQPFEGSRIEEIFHTLWQSILRLLQFSSLSEEKIHDVVAELEKSLIATCCEYMQNAKFAIVQFFFKKGYADRVVTWLEEFIDEIQDKVKAADEELNNLAKAIYFMKVGVQVCMDVDACLSRLNTGLCECYGRRYTSSQMMQPKQESCGRHKDWGFDCPKKEPAMINTLKTAESILKEIRRLSIRFDTPTLVYKPAARATLRRSEKRRVGMVMRPTEMSERIAFHAETVARELMSKHRSPTVSHSDVHVGEELDDDFTGDLTSTCQAAARRLTEFSHIYPNLLSAMSQNALQELERKDQKKILISVTGGLSCGMSTFIHALVGEKLLPDDGVSTLLEEVVIVTNAHEGKVQPCLTQSLDKGPSIQYAGAEKIRQALEKHAGEPLSRIIQVFSALLPPSTHEQWKIDLSCHAELAPTKKERLANIAKRSDAIIHIISYDDVKRKDNCAFEVLAKVIQYNDSKFREKDGAVIVVTRLEVWFKGYSQPVKKEQFEKMFSVVRSTIRNQVWDKAGVYLNEDIILPLCDKWACTAHQLRRVVNVQSIQRSELLVDAQNILSENYVDPNESDYCDDEVIARKLMDCSCSSNMEIVVLRMIKTCCEETSEKLAGDFKIYLNNSIYKLEGQRNLYDRLITDLATESMQQLEAPQAGRQVSCNKSIEELREEKRNIKTWQQHLADLRETILILASGGCQNGRTTSDQH